MISTRVLLACGLLLSGVYPLALPRHAAAQPAAADRQIVSRITVTVPQDDAELLVNERTIEGTGPSRTIETGPLTRGTTYKYSVTAKWRPNGYTTMTRTKDVTFLGGEPVTVDLSVEDPGDRVRVIYVPTPYDVAEKMVELAGVRPDDVIYEPGCGDARITIAAIRAGARRGICVDIDPERAAESRENVRMAGFADRIDVRLGDALDMKDLSEVTVVFLYMGEHFNMLIRPVLWRDLKVGSRIVSHRFDMEDWTPDRSLTMGSEEGGEYVLHLWTIDEDDKKR